MEKQYFLAPLLVPSIPKYSSQGFLWLCWDRQEMAATLRSACCICMIAGWFSQELWRSLDWGWSCLPPPPPRQHETSSKRQSLKSQTPERDLPVRLGPQNCLCPIMEVMERCPWFPGTCAFCSWNVAQTLILNHINKFCAQEFPGTFHSLGPHQQMFVPRNFLALFPGPFLNVPRNCSWWTVVHKSGPRSPEGNCCPSWNVRPEILKGEIVFVSPE